MNKSSNQNTRRREIASNRALSDVEINACTVVISCKTEPVILITVSHMSQNKTTQKKIYFVLIKTTNLLIIFILTYQSISILRLLNEIFLTK